MKPTPGSMDGRCENCRWIDLSISSAILGEETALCRRNPPGFDDRTGKAIWPFVEMVDWCGEFEPSQENSDD